MSLSGETSDLGPCYSALLGGSEKKRRSPLPPRPTFREGDLPTFQLTDWPKMAEEKTQTALDTSLVSLATAPSGPHNQFSMSRPAWGPLKLRPL